jgi:hypothetical protein
VRTVAPIEPRVLARLQQRQAIIRRISPECNEVRYLVWIDAISLPYLFGPDVRYFSYPVAGDAASARGQLACSPMTTDQLRTPHRVSRLSCSFKASNRGPPEETDRACRFRP